MIYLKIINKAEKYLIEVEILNNESMESKVKAIEYWIRK